MIGEPLWYWAIWIVCLATLALIGRSMRLTSKNDLRNTFARGAYHARLAERRHRAAADAYWSDPVVRNEAAATAEAIHLRRIIDWLHALTDRVDVSDAEFAQIVTRIGEVA